MPDGIRSTTDFFTSLGVALPTMSLIAMTILAFYVWNRTQSSYSLLARLWQLFHGSKDCKNKEIAEFLDEQFALMQFRFTTGIPARTRRHAIAVIDWARRNNEDVGAVASCGPYFDFENIKLKEEKELPRKWHLTCRFLLVLFLLFVAMSSFSGAFFDRAILQLKSSGTYFTLSVNDAKPIGYEPGFNLKQCASGKLPSDNVFNKKDVDVICELLKDKNLDSYLTQTIKQQKIVFSIATFPFAWIFWIVFSWLMQGVRAWDMLKRLDKKKDPAMLSLAENRDT